MAGGTGGHVFPALAVAETLRGKGVRIVWLGTKNGIEADLVPKAKFDIEWINIKGVRRSGLLRKIILPLTLLRAVCQSVKVILRQRPDALLGMGGFVSGPGGLAGWLLRKPLLIHEQNAVAGMTNSCLASIACFVMSGFPDTFAAKKVSWMGNPVRESIRRLPEPAIRLQNRDNALRVLVAGGSQGASVFNEKLPGIFASCAEGLPLVIRHQCGRNNFATVTGLYQQNQHKRISNVEVSEFIDNMANAYEWCDLVICRAGAMTVSEVTAAGVCAVFVPYPHAVSDHQTANARYVVDGNAGFLVAQEHLDTDHLKPVLTLFSNQRERLLQMSQASRQLAKPNATEEVTSKCIEVLYA